MYEYHAIIKRVVDGDTVDIDIDLGFGIILKDERVRISGIDTPESRTRDKVEKIFGLASKARLKEMLGKKSILCCKEYDSKGKFGRILGDFWTPVGMISERLIEEGHAVQYNGENKKLVQDQHMANRERLIAEGKVRL